MLKQSPTAGSRIIAHAGDTVEFRLEAPDTADAEGWLRSNLTGAPVHRLEVIAQTESSSVPLDRDWFDLPMERTGPHSYSIRIPVYEPGYFQAKTFLLKKNLDHPIWPAGDNIFIKVEPAERKDGNSIYSAFVRIFGESASSISVEKTEKKAIELLDAREYSVIPKSGKFRDLIKELDTIVGHMGFRNILLLPIHPAPTTYARMGRFGSPFAALDLMDIDPALAVFDRKTTPLDQFRELLDAAHARGACIFMDMPLNHTGWASALQIHHPKWFMRDRTHQFQSPGAWGVTWEDLAELNYKEKELWRYMADVFLYWCRLGVDGFRCDAGYMVPAQVWEYITAKVRQQFPDTVLLLEGLGGKKSVMHTLLTRSNLNWAYSELFQNYDRSQIEGYIPEANEASEHDGLLVHFAETHDNNRMAATSPEYARMRTTLCALLSTQGSFGITCGAEWFATEKIDVHERTDMNWGSKRNQVDHIARLNTILRTHPAFTFGSRTEILHSGSNNTIAAKRTSADGASFALVLVNLDIHRKAELEWRDSSQMTYHAMTDLLSGNSCGIHHEGALHRIALEPAQVLCLSSSMEPDAWRSEYRQQALAKAVRIAASRQAAINWTEDTPSRLADEMLADPVAFARRCATPEKKGTVITWSWPQDATRTVPVPSDSHIVIFSPSPFSCDLVRNDFVLSRDKSIPFGGGWFTILTCSGIEPGQAILEMQVYEGGRAVRSKAELLLLGNVSSRTKISLTRTAAEVRSLASSALCTNGRGAMSLVNGAWGEIRCQYDCLLAGNLHPEVPSDRHIMLTRCRAWLVLRGYSQQIDLGNLEEFRTSPPNCAEWDFSVPAGMGKRILLRFSLDMKEGVNQADLRLSRIDRPDMPDRLDPDTDVRIILRFDIEDRSFHSKTKAFTGPEHAWPRQVSASHTGFVFRPAHDRTLSLNTTRGSFTREDEWTYMAGHPVDSERGLDGSSDLFSPGYFSIHFKDSESACISATINTNPVEPAAGKEKRAPEVSLDYHLRSAMNQFIVKRGRQKTVIAGYPWFLDWGRDTLICLRGMITCGMIDECKAILRQFASFEQGGTIPNMISGEDASNRDTSDAPLWMHAAVSDLIAAEGTAFLDMDCAGRRLADVLVSIGNHYISGTSNGIKVDRESGLVFSPSHFTWMDTNHPAGTPREGYPIEIQALWYNCTSLLASITGDSKWSALREQVRNSLEALYFSESMGYLSDCLHCGYGTPAKKAHPDDHLRPNQLLAITLGAVTSHRICESVISSCQALLVPGAIRTLADRPVKFSLPVVRNGVCLNDPSRPYWPRYSGDEDTRRKPAYHNGTAWTWPFPSYCEALVKTYGQPAAATALSYLSGTLRIMEAHCIGQIPEILDGDSPHSEKGCTAQAWGVSEFTRVLALLEKIH